VAARTESLSYANRELTRAIATIRDNEEHLREDIAKARLFQEKMLPTVAKYEHLDIESCYRPLQQVGGDIFDIAKIGNGHVRLLVADATGHGVQAAMRTILLKSAYDRIKYQQATPSAVLEALNETLVQQFPDGDLHCAATCVDLQLTASALNVTYANAANGPVFVFSPEQPVLEVYHAGPLLGVDLVEIPSTPPLTMKAGQLLLIPSDGLYEQSNPRRERFEGPLKRVVMKGADTAAAFGERLLADFDGFREDQPLGDDVTFIAVRFAPNSAPQA
jgi:sigma-B regulation protein RsbU (phosphoserine phosphatase)